MRLLLLLQYKFQLDISDSCTLSRTLSLFLSLYFSLAAQRNCDFSRMLFILLLLLLLLLLRYISHLGRQTDRHTHTRTHMYMHAIDSLSLSASPYLSLSILSTLSVIRIMEQQKKLRCLFFVLLLNFIIEILSPPSHQPTTMTLLFPSSI